VRRGIFIARGTAMEEGTVSKCHYTQNSKLTLVFQERSIVTGVWRVNTVTVTIASVSMALGKMARGIRDARDTDSLVSKKIQMDQQFSLHVSFEFQ
jgi:hypothetical protein